MRLIILIGAILTVLTASSASSQEPFGSWLRPSTGGGYSVYDCGGKLCVKVSSTKDPAKASLVGVVIIAGAQKTSANKWQGEIKLEDGKIYPVNVTLDSPSELTVKGCALGGLVCRGETWKRQ